MFEIMDTEFTPTQTNDSSQLLQNILAALTVSCVALSLGAAFGILSLRGAFPGMLSAAIIALVTSFFGGTRIQCSGPTAPMTSVMAVIMAYAVGQVGMQNLGILPNHFVNVVLLLTGILLILMGILRLGKLIRLVPNVVVSGFMSGIAMLIWIDQVSRLFGLYGKTPFEGSMINNTIVALVTCRLIFAMPKLLSFLLPKKYVKIIPATFIVIVLMTVICNLLHLRIEHVSINVSIKSFADFTAIFKNQLPQTISLSVFLLALPFSLQLAALCYLDTLLTSLVIDKMTKEKTKQNQELLAQGFGNAICAFFGGIPGAQATIRSVLIIKEKATSRVAGILVGVFVLIELILFQDIINFIPQAVFSGVLLKVGYDVFDFTPFRLYFFSKNDDNIIVTNRELLIIILTALATTFWNLNIAVLSFSLFFHLHNNYLAKDNPMADLKPSNFN